MLFSYVTEHSSPLHVFVVAHASFYWNFAIEMPFYTFCEFKKWGYTAARHRLECVRVPTVAIGLKTSPSMTRFGL